MPPSRADWSPLNIEVAADAGAASCTVWMNRIDAALASSLQRNVFQTWNPTAEPAADLVVVDLPFDRPVMNAKTVEALAEVRDRQGEGGVWIVGAYYKYSAAWSVKAVDISPGGGGDPMYVVQGEKL